MRRILVALSLFSCGGSAYPSRAPSPRPVPERSPEAPVVEVSNAPTSSADNAEAGTFELAVEGFEPALVVLPRTTQPVPLVVAAHGAGGSPEWQCDHWSRVVGQRGILLCPRGRRISSKYAGSYYYPDHHELGREFVASLTALRARFAGRILEGVGIYTGFSQGATMGALMIVDHGHEFPFLLLIEGATAEFSGARARAFKASGGQRVDYVCGGGWCAGRAERMVATLESAGIEASLAHVSGGGHTDDGRVGEKAAERFEELLARAVAQGRR